VVFCGYEKVKELAVVTWPTAHGEPRSKTVVNESEKSITEASLSSRQKGSIAVLH
jgi:hypothetical protein